MNETLDRHFVVPLSDEDFQELHVQAAKAGLKIKDWVSQAIGEKLIKEMLKED